MTVTAVHHRAATPPVSAGCVTGCGRPATGMCPACWAQLSGTLGALDWLTVELDTALSRQARFGAVALGVVTRTSEQPLPADLRASDTAHRLGDTLTVWVRQLHAEHAVRWRQCDTCGARCTDGAPLHDVRPPLACPGTWVEHTDPLTVDRTVPELARWLLRHPTWVRGHSRAGDLYHDVMGAVNAGYRVIDRPPDRVYIGICSAPLVHANGVPVVDVDGDAVRCEADLYAVKDTATVRCHACGTVHLVTDRQQVLAKAVENELAPVATLVGLVGELGTKLTSDVLRGFKRRGQLQPKVRGADGYIRLRVATDEGPDTFRVGDVLDLLPRLRKRGAVREAS